MTKFIGILSMVILVLQFSPVSFADQVAPAPEFLCEAQAQSLTPQILIEMGLSQGLLSGPEDLVLLADLVSSNNLDSFIQGGHTLQNQMYRQTLVRFVERWPNKEELVQWIRERVVTFGGMMEVRGGIHQTVAEISIKRPKMEFVTVKGGRFWVPLRLLKEVKDPQIPRRTAVHVNIPYDLAVLAAPVTHEMWLAVMGKMPRDLNVNSKYFSQDDLDEAPFKGELFRTARNYPITHITFASIAEFANRLSIEHGYKPAYENLTFGDGDPTEGTAILKNAYMMRDVSQIEGYRIMLDLEWAVVFLKAYRILERLKPQDQLQQLLEWGWFKSNSPGGILHPVAQRQPFYVGGAPLYDFLGLVRELTHDRPLVTSKWEPVQTSNLEKLSGRSEFIIRGGGHISDPMDLTSLDNFDSVHSRIDEVRITGMVDNAFLSLPNHGFKGFRLVRTVKWQPKKANR